MKLLDAVNYALPKLGEHEVTSLDTKHPTIAILLPIIEVELRLLLGKGWWFNEFDYTAYPDSEGAITLGTDTIEFVPNTPATAVLRGLNLFNAETLSYVFSESVTGRVRQYVGFEEIPESAALVVLHRALVNAYATDIGVASEVELWNGAAQSAYSDLLAEHLRQKKYSTQKSSKWRNLRRALRG